MSATDQSRRLFELLRLALQQAIDERTPDRQWDFQSRDSLEQVVQRQAVILTLASFKYRLICLLHFNISDRALIRETLAGGAGKGEEQDYRDFIMEFGNSFCGRLKRDMQAFSPPIGMSTPNILPSSSLDFLDSTDAGHATHLLASTTSGDPLSLGASALLYVHPGYELDIPRIEADAAESAGELELF